MNSYCLPWVSPCSGWAFQGALHSSLPVPQPSTNPHLHPDCEHLQCWLQKYFLYPWLTTIKIKQRQPNLSRKMDKNLLKEVKRMSLCSRPITFHSAGPVGLWLWGPLLGSKTAPSILMKANGKFCGLGLIAYRNAADYNKESTRHRTQ